MAQAYATTYSKAYKWFDFSKSRREKMKVIEPIYEKPPKADIWLETIGTRMFEDATVDDLLKFVNKMYRSRQWSIYQVSYCKDIVAKAMQFDEEITEIPENEIIEHGKRLYEKKTQKILKPMASARKIYGYMRPEDMYMPNSLYEDVHGKLGYEILNKRYIQDKN